MILKEESDGRSFHLNRLNLWMASELFEGLQTAFQRSVSPISPVLKIVSFIGKDRVRQLPVFSHLCLQIEDLKMEFHTCYPLGLDVSPIEPE